jgi:hypothetical protein
MRENFSRLLNSVHGDCFVSRDKVYVGCGPTLWCLVFCSHRDYFAVTRNFTAVYLDLLSSNSFTVTLGFTAVYQDWQKTRHRDADGT